jgi:hypothetical protein
MHISDTLVVMRAKSQHDELRRINRVTGLEFQSVPESLLGRQEEWEAFAESLLTIAVATWKGDVG